MNVSAQTRPHLPRSRSVLLVLPSLTCLPTENKNKSISIPGEVNSICRLVRSDFGEDLFKTASQLLKSLVFPSFLQRHGGVSCELCVGCSLLPSARVTRRSPQSPRRTPEQQGILKEGTLRFQPQRISNGCPLAEALTALAGLYFILLFSKVTAYDQRIPKGSSTRQTRPTRLAGRVAKKVRSAARLVVGQPCGHGGHAGHAGHGGLSWDGLNPSALRLGPTPTRQRRKPTIQL